MKGNVMKRVPCVLTCAIAVALLGASALQASAAEAVKHRFLVVDNAAHKLICVDQHDPTKGWAVPIPAPKSRDLQRVGGGKVLASHPNGAAEYELATGRKVWEITTYKGVHTARRLECGNTLLGANTAAGITIYEVTREGKEVSRRVVPNKGGTLRVMRRLGNGNLLLNLGSPYRAAEIDPAGKIVWQVALPKGGKGYKVQRLASGNTLLSTGGLASVIEVTPAGKTVATFGGKAAHPKAGLDFASGFDRLDNGNVVIANWLGHGSHPNSPHVVEYDRDNTLVWSWGDHKLAKVATNVMILDGRTGAATAGGGKGGTWQALFDGKTLKGWTNPYDWGKAAVVDGEIHLTTTKRKFFLVTEKQYSDFIFEADVRLPEGKANSGFMFRCHQKPNKVWGYQAEVDPSDRKWSGGLYDEGRRKWFISPSRDVGTKEHRAKTIADFRKRAGDCFKRGQWNTYRIECRGESIKISVNGVLTTDVKDSMDAKGYIALQHHGEKGKVYRFRNIRIQDLSR